jgi:hypothetical protein
MPKASPLKVLDEEPRRAKGAASVPGNKRKRAAARPAVPAEPAAEEEGIFFTKSRPPSFLNPSLRSRLTSCSQGEVDGMRQEISQLRARVSELERMNAALVREKRQRKANGADFDQFGLQETAAGEILVGTEDALALLHKIENAARESTTASTGVDTSAAPPIAVASPATASATASTTTASPPRPVKTPSFFSRSFSAIKSTLGFTPATPQPPSPTPAPLRASSSTPNTMTDVLSLPPTPVGERSKAPPKKKQQGPMFKLFLKGVEPSDMAKAEAWAKHAIPAFRNRKDFEAQRTRLQTPLLVQDLEHFPPCKPWETGYGDPLGELEDDAVVPVWAVYAAILAEDEQPTRKKAKSSHEESMGIDDSPSIDEMASAGQSMQTPLQAYNSQGTSASHLDMHPRRARQPSPMFGSSENHHQGNNLFRERRGQDTTTEGQMSDREALQAATNKVVSNPGTAKDVATKHNPSQGSYGLDYDSDEEDSTMLSDSSEVAGSASPLWTQPPPQAPVPAHATLPGGAGDETLSESMSQQPVDEVERQRQKLMKHTPAKPSRLREAFVPSPSLMSEAGNTPIPFPGNISVPFPGNSSVTFPGTSSPVPGNNSVPVAESPTAPFVFDDMPEAEDLELTAEDWAGVEALRNSDAWKAANSVPWPDPHMTYDSDEEDLSPL